MTTKELRALCSKKAKYWNDYAERYGCESDREDYTLALAVEAMLPVMEALEAWAAIEGTGTHPGSKRADVLAAYSQARAKIGAGVVSEIQALAAKVGR